MRAHAVAAKVVAVVAHPKPRIVHRLDVERRGQRLLDVVVARVRRAEAVAGDHVVAEVEVADVLALKTNAQGVDRHHQPKAGRPVNRRKKQAAVVVGVVPVVDRSVHLSHNHAVVGCVIEPYAGPFDAGHEAVVTCAVAVARCWPHHRL